MLYTIPDYYKEFTCIADRCEDTCCAGWQIVIDKKSLAKYKKMPDDFGRIMRKKVNWITGTFRQDKENPEENALTVFTKDFSQLIFRHEVLRSGRNSMPTAGCSRRSRRQYPVLHRLRKDLDKDSFPWSWD